MGSGNNAASDRQAHHNQYKLPKRGFFRFLIIAISHPGEHTFFSTGLLAGFVLPVTLCHALCRYAFTHTQLCRDFTGRNSPFRVYRNIHSLLLRQIHRKIVCPGNETAGDCKADHEQYETGKRRLCGLLGGQGNHPLRITRWFFCLRECYLKTAKSEKTGWKNSTSTGL